MAISEAHKRGVQKWDRANMCSFSCRVRSYEAVAFQDYCKKNNTTPYRVLKECILKCIDENSEKNGIK